MDTLGAKMSYSHSLDRSFLICFTRSAYTAFALSGKRRKIAHPVFHRFSEQITDDDADDADAGWRVETEGGNFTRLYLVDWPTTFLAAHFVENGNISASNNECTVAAGKWQGLLQDSGGSAILFTCGEATQVNGCL